MQRIKKDGYIDVSNKKGVSLLHLIWHFVSLSLPWHLLLKINYKTWAYDRYMNQRNLTKISK
jgi:hypothetical protein